MCLQNMMNLGVSPVEACVKIDDTRPGIEEGLNGGMWTIGLAISGNEIGLSLKDWKKLPKADQERMRAGAYTRMYQSGAHYVVDAITDIVPCLDDIEATAGAGRAAVGQADRRDAAPASSTDRLPRQRLGPFVVRRGAARGLAGAERERHRERGLRELQHLGEFLVGETARGVARAVEVGEFPLASGLQREPADAERLQRLPDVGIVRAREAHHERDRIVAPEHRGEPQDDLERQRHLAVLDELEQRRDP